MTSDEPNSRRPQEGDGSLTHSSPTRSFTTSDQRHVQTTLEIGDLSDHTTRATRDGSPSHGGPPSTLVEAIAPSDVVASDTVAPGASRDPALPPINATADIIQPSVPIDCSSGQDTQPLLPTPTSSTPSPSISESPTFKGFDGVCRAINSDGNSDDVGGGRAMNTLVDGGLQLSKQYIHGEDGERFKASALIRHEFLQRWLDRVQIHHFHPEKEVELKWKVGTSARVTYWLRKAGWHFRRIMRSSRSVDCPQLELPDRRTIPIKGWVDIDFIAGEADHVRFPTHRWTMRCLVVDQLVRDLVIGDFGMFMHDIRLTLSGRIPFNAGTLIGAPPKSAPGKLFPNMRV
jgi:hypothetical protein